MHRPPIHSPALQAGFRAGPSMTMAVMPVSVPDFVLRRPPKNRLTRADPNPVGCFAAHPNASRHHQKQLIHPCRMKTDDTAGSKCMHPSWKSPSERTIREPPTFRLPNRLIMCRTSASKRKNRMDSLPKFFTPRRVPPFVKRFRSRGSLMKRLAKIRFFPAFERIHLTGLRNSAQYEKIAERPGSKIFVADGVGGEAFRPQKNPLKIPAAAIGHVSSASREEGKSRRSCRRTPGKFRRRPGAWRVRSRPFSPDPCDLEKTFRRRNGCSRASSPGPTCRIPRRKSSIPRRSPACAREPPAPSTAFEAPVPF